MLKREIKGKMGEGGLREVTKKKIQKVLSDENKKNKKKDRCGGIQSVTAETEKTVSQCSFSPFKISVLICKDAYAAL